MRTAAVSAGRVTRMVDTVQTVRKSRFCSHIRDRRWGHLRFKPPVRRDRDLSASRRTETRRRRASHSPAKGTGQAMHHTLPPAGTRTVMRRNHHRIQTIVTMMLRLPIGEPKKPATTKKKSTSRLGRTTANWNHRRVTSHRSPGSTRKRSIRRPGVPFAVRETPLPNAPVIIRPKMPRVRPQAAISDAR
jgi:hypothetical protein